MTLVPPSTQLCDAATVQFWSARRSVNGEASDDGIGERIEPWEVGVEERPAQALVGVSCPSSLNVY